MNPHARCVVAAAALSLGYTGIAAAAFTHFSMDGGRMGTSDYWMMNIYGNFNSPTDRAYFVANSAITTTIAGGFFQSAENPFWKPGAGQNKNTSVDSWVTLGANPNGNGNAYSETVGDGNFLNFADYSGTTTYDFSVIEGSRDGGAGWYNASPLNAYGFPMDGKVLLAHFVFYVPGVGENQAPMGTVKFLAFIGWKEPMYGFHTNGSYAVFQFVPGPGALAIWTLPGLMKSRQRRGERGRLMAPKHAV